MENVINIYGDVDSRPAGRSTTAEMVVSRQAQEVQAAMVIAKKFPRNEADSFNRIMQACKRKTLRCSSLCMNIRG